MRALLFAAVLCSTARAQFTIVTDQRTVMARVAQFHDLTVDPFWVVDEIFGGDVATAYIPGAGQATAWQVVSLGPAVLDMSGGVRDLTAWGVRGETRSSGHSEVLLTFDISRATRAMLTVTIDDPPTLLGRGNSTVPGDAMFMLRGPSDAALAGREAEIGFRRDIDEGDPWWTNYPPFTSTEEFLLSPGRYTAHVLAGGFFSFSDPEYKFRNVSYDFRLEAVAIPEPATWAPAMIVLLSTGWRSVRRRL